MVSGRRGSLPLSGSPQLPTEPRPSQEHSRPCIHLESGSIGWKANFPSHGSDGKSDSGPRLTSPSGDVRPTFRQIRTYFTTGLDFLSHRMRERARISKRVPTTEIAGSRELALNYSVSISLCCSCVLQKIYNSRKGKSDGHAGIGWMDSDPSSCTRPTRRRARGSSNLILPPFQNIVRPRFPRSNFDHKFNQRDQLRREKKLYN